MITRFSFIVIIGILLISCGSNENHSQTEDEISGTYVKEYSLKVVNLETGTEVGIRNIRDTIFVHPKDRGYEVANKKWFQNSYDREGWRDMIHAEDRPLPNYQATFDPTDSTLYCESGPSIHLNIKKRQLFRSDKQDKPYQK